MGSNQLVEVWTKLRQCLYSRGQRSRRPGNNKVSGLLRVHLLQGPRAGSLLLKRADCLIEEKSGGIRELAQVATNDGKIEEDQCTFCVFIFLLPLGPDTSIQFTHKSKAFFVHLSKATYFRIFGCVSLLTPLSYGLWMMNIYHLGGISGKLPLFSFMGRRIDLQLGLNSKVLVSSGEEPGCAPSNY